MIHDPFLDDTCDPKGCAGALAALLLSTVVWLAAMVLLVSITHRFL